jgi:stage II sporulation protein D
MPTLRHGQSHLIPYRNRRSMVRVTLLLGILLVAPATPTHAAAGSIRVLLLQDLASLPLSVPPDYSILTQPVGLLAADDDRWRTLQLQVNSGNIRIRGLGLEVEELRLAPRSREAVIYAGGKLYRGHLEVKWRAGGLMVINTLDLEEYLYGVVPKETPAQWEMAALRAQAIVARTYALYKQARQAHHDYDVGAQYVRDQHYEGYSAEHPRTTQAVDDTRGLVLTCRGELIPAYYHAESAGYTEDSEHVWSSPHPCLRAVKAPMHHASPYLQWSATLSLRDMRAALAKQGYAVGAIRRLEPVQRSPSGRITLLKIGHQSGETVLRGTDFRLALGPEVIRSTRFTVQVRDGRAFFNGQGWGHGVGLCQWCSRGMAEQGYDHEAILTHYYRGAKLIQYR